MIFLTLKNSNCPVGGTFNWHLEPEDKQLHFFSLFFLYHVYISCLKLVVQVTFLLHKYAPLESCRKNISSNKHDKYKVLTNLIRVLLLTCSNLFNVTRLWTFWYLWQSKIFNSCFLKIKGIFSLRWWWNSKRHWTLFKIFFSSEFHSSCLEWLIIQKHLNKIPFSPESD